MALIFRDCRRSLFRNRLTITINSRFQTTYHQRPLPSTLISFSSVEGKELFREALLDGGMESFFPLSEQFITQSEPSFCAISSLAMVLNALKYDPKKVWKGPWRWYSEETLYCEATKSCQHDIDFIKQNGMDFSEFESLGRCHDILLQSFRVVDLSLSTSSTSMDSPSNSQNVHSMEDLSKFREAIVNISYSSSAEMFIIVNFSRKYLGQTGDGHFSPIGGYHRRKDLVLIMDVARFKYPPFWVPLADLWNSMSLIDKKTGATRGYFILSSKNSKLQSERCKHDNSINIDTRKDNKFIC